MLGGRRQAQCTLRPAELEEELEAQAGSWGFGERAGKHRHRGGWRATPDRLARRFDKRLDSPAVCTRLGCEQMHRHLPC